MNKDLQELYNKFDGSPSDAANARMAWYGQQRAAGMSHAEAIADTAKQFAMWVQMYWPKRNIPLPEDWK